MKYLGAILGAYIVLFILDIMQKRNHKKGGTRMVVYAENDSK